MRAVLDTNVVLSAILWGGVPLQLLSLGRAGKLELWTSEALLRELETVLGRPKFLERLHQGSMTAQSATVGYRALTTLTSPVRVASTSRDPDDDVVLGTAVAAQADLIVSGDQDLLDLQSFCGTRVITVATAMSILGLP